MGRFAGFLFLVVLAASATKLPQKLTSLMSGSKRTGDVYVKKQTTYNESVVSGLDADNRAYAKEAAPEMEIHMTPMMGAMVEASKNLDKRKKGAERSKMTMPNWQAWVQENESQIVSWIWRVPLALLGAGLLTFMIGLKAAGRNFVMLCYTLSRQWLFLLSVAAVIAFAAKGVNLWAALPGAVLSVPVVAIFASIAFLRVIDMNYPIWNSTVSSLLAPIAASVIIAVWGKAVVVIKS